MTAASPIPASSATVSKGPLPGRARVTRIDRRLHANYRNLDAIRRWTWSRITPAGALVLWTMAGAGSFTDVSQTLAHQVFAFLGCLSLLSLAWVLGRKPRLSLTRSIPNNASVGEPFPVRIQLHNLARRWVRNCQFREGFPDYRPTLVEFATLEEPNESHRNWFDRRYRFYRWRWLCNRNIHAVAESIPIPDIPPEGEVRLTFDLVPRRRGRLTLTAATAARMDPFRLIRRVNKIQDQPSSIVVYPRRFSLPRMPLPGLTQQWQRGGVALAGSVGDSEEFTSIRDYRPGDPMRKFHWAGWARTQRPVVKEFQEEYFVRHAMLLDTVGGGPDSDAFEDAVSLAASFACDIDQHDTLLDLMFVGDHAYMFTAGRGLAHSAQMLEILAGVELRPDGNPADLEELVFRHIDRLSGCVLIFLRWDEPRRNLRQRLEIQRVPTLTFIIHPTPAPATLDLPTRTFWLQSGNVEETLRSLDPRRFTEFS